MKVNLSSRAEECELQLRPSRGMAFLAVAKAEEFCQI